MTSMTTTDTPSVDRKAIIEGLMKTPAGRVKVATAMTEPIRQTIYRRAMYPRLFGVHAPAGHWNPHTCITAHVEEPLHLVRDAIQPFVESTLTRLSEAIIREADALVMSAIAWDLDARTDRLPVPFAGGTVLLCMDDLPWFHRHTRHMFDPECQREMLRSGTLGGWLGSMVRTSPAVPQGLIFFVPDSWGLWTETLTVESRDDPLGRLIGFHATMYLDVQPGCERPLSYRIPYKEIL